MFARSGRNTSTGHAILALALISALAAGCASDSPTNPDTPALSVSRSTDSMTPEAAVLWNQARPVGFSTLAKEEFGPYWSPGMYLLTSVKDWEACMDKLVAAGTLLPEFVPSPPQVDWKKEAVVLISLGLRPTSCYDVEIRGIRRHGSTVLVEVERSRPKLGGRYCYQTYIAPYHLVRIERHPSMRRIAEI